MALRDATAGEYLVLARPVGIAVSEPWYLVSTLDPSPELVWLYRQRFCGEQLFRAQKSGIVQLERSGLQGDAVSLAGERRRVDPHWKRPELYPHRPALAAAERDHSRPCPSGLAADPAPGPGVEPWFSRVELPSPLPCTPATAVAGPSRL